MNECKNHQSQIVNRKSKSIVLVLFCATILFPIFNEPSTVYADHASTVLFYNPESNVGNFASLKSKMDLYLRKRGNWRFQPFNNKEIFEKQYRNNQSAIVILSSWHYKKLKKESGIKPVFVGVVNGKTTQKKILSSKKAVNDINMLKGSRIAFSGNDEYTRNLLKKMLGEENEKLVDSFKLLGVPKDIDALIAVGFGVADAALTTESSIDMLSSINPPLKAKIKTIARSKDILLPIVAIRGETSPEIVKLLSALKNMVDSDNGSQGIQRIGLDMWTKLDEKDLELLN